MSSEFKKKERMNLEALLRDLDVIGTTGPRKGEVSSVCYDSRKCAPGSLFLAIPGFKSDGHEFIPAALRAGARYIICEREVSAPQDVTIIRVRDSRRALGLVGKNFYRDPSADLCVVGVTGTNGKTTVTFLLESIFQAAGFSTGVLGTINYRYAGEVLPAPNTTPESIELQRILREMANAGVTHAAMEVSSHALDLGRVADCSFRAGIFTNLTQDHLDYHKTMEDYFRAKKILFGMLERSAAPAILNIDDAWGERLRRETSGSVFTCSLEREADFTAVDAALSVQGIRAVLKTPGGPFPVQSPLIGRFNLYNILAAAAAAQALGIPVGPIQVGIERLANIPGRMEKVSRPGEPVVFVDYAHTEDALKRALQNISQFKRGKIITVFGCGGDRDRGKRPLMGKAAVAYSDLTILTSDNPRSEDPKTIIAEIERGINGTCRKYDSSEILASGTPLPEKGYAIVSDRRSAIRTAIALAGSSDIVLVAGKGHENYQILGERIIAFDDRIVSREFLDGFNAGKSSGARLRGQK